MEIGLHKGGEELCLGKFGTDLDIFIGFTSFIDCFSGISLISYLTFEYKYLAIKYSTPIL